MIIDFRVVVNLTCLQLHDISGVIIHISTCFWPLSLLDKICMVMALPVLLETSKISEIILFGMKHWQLAVQL